VSKSIEKLYEAIISSAYSFKTRGAYGSFENAAKAVMKRKPVVEMGLEEIECDRLFTLAVKVVDDSLEFEKNYIRSHQVVKSASGWVDRATIQEVGRKMESHLKDKNPDAPAIFIERSVARIYYLYYFS
jgi:hypothetical protein